MAENIKYFVLKLNEDGEVTLREYSEVMDVEQMLEDDPARWHNSVPNDDIMYSKPGMWVFRGMLLTPSPDVTAERERRHA